MDVLVEYDWKIKDTVLTLGMQVFNIFDSKEITAFNDNVESTAGITDPDYLQPLAFQTPRQYVFSATWAW